MNDEERQDVIREAIQTLRFVQSKTQDSTALSVALVAVHRNLSALARDLRGGKSGQARILEILESMYPEAVDGETLRVLSGIQEFARRIRELRVEQGYDIRYDGAGYRLAGLDPNPEVVDRWQMLHSVRGSRGSATDRLRTVFDGNIGTVFSSDQLIYVAQISEWARRVRELRSDEGMRIESHHDNPDLSPGEYVLVDGLRIPTNERAVNAELRRQALERDRYRCVKCGGRPDTPGRVWLEVDHRLALQDGGENNIDNLQTLCNSCHRAKSTQRRA